MPIRLVSLNVNHRTHARVIRPGLAPAFHALRPDVLVLNEYVEGRGRPEFHQALREIGLTHIKMSDTENYSRARWRNQILIASRSHIEDRPLLDHGPEACCSPNFLSVHTFGFDLTGLRVPAYTTARDWYGYWEWLTSVIGGDVAIGDFNVDPRRTRKWDRVLPSLADAHGFKIVTPENSWSFRHSRGAEHQIDHALVRHPARATSARYEADRFVPEFTDHAALIVELERLPGDEANACAAC
ncbi:MAG: endonuclease/exonuclease/phosphatase family protein [Phycisphaerales bacterium]|nr:endonuclease/exonuclease/phosphatase family protein [Phycisphaerales bacterium]